MSTCSKFVILLLTLALLAPVGSRTRPVHASEGAQLHIVPAGSTVSMVCFNLAENGVITASYVVLAWIPPEGKQQIWIGEYPIGPLPTDAVVETTTDFELMVSDDLYTSSLVADFPTLGRFELYQERAAGNTLVDKGACPGLDYYAYLHSPSNKLVNSGWIYATGTLDGKSFNERMRYRTYGFETTGFIYLSPMGVLY